MSQEKPAEITNDEVKTMEDEGDEDALQIFAVMHDSIDALEDRFVEFVDNPTVDKHKEFDDLVKEFISLSRDLKNMAKSILPASDKKKKDKPVLNIATENHVEEQQPKKKGKKKANGTP